MRGMFGSGILAAVIMAGPASAQYGGTPLQQAAAHYAHCVNEKARAAERSGASVDAAVSAGFSRCKSQRKRAVKETRSRITAAGIGGAGAKSTAESVIASADHSLAASLRQELAGRRGTVATSPK